MFSHYIQVLVSLIEFNQVLYYCSIELEVCLHASGELSMQGLVSLDEFCLTLHFRLFSRCLMRSFFKLGLIVIIFVRKVFMGAYFRYDSLFAL